LREHGRLRRTVWFVSAQEQANRMLANDLATRSLGIEISEVSEGAATATMTVRPDMSNGHGICHGGYVFLLADTAFAFACNTYGVATVAAGADVEFLMPVAVGERLVARAHEVLLRGRAGVYDVEVRRGDELVAAFRGRSHALKP
jgi:acyl-CoA thioesterase